MGKKAANMKRSADYPLSSEEEAHDSSGEEDPEEQEDSHSATAVSRKADGEKKKKKGKAAASAAVTSASAVGKSAKKADRTDNNDDDGGEDQDSQSDGGNRPDPDRRKRTSQQPAARQPQNQQQDRDKDNGEDGEEGEQDEDEERELEEDEAFAFSTMKKPNDNKSRQSAQQQQKQAKKQQQQQQQQQQQPAASRKQKQKRGVNNDMDDGDDDGALDNGAGALSTTFQKLNMSTASVTRPTAASILMMGQEEEEENDDDDGNDEDKDNAEDQSLSKGGHASAAGSGKTHKQKSTAAAADKKPKQQQQQQQQPKGKKKKEEFVPDWLDELDQSTAQSAPTTSSESKGQKPQADKKKEKEKPAAASTSTSTTSAAPKQKEKPKEKPAAAPPAAAAAAGASTKKPSAAVLKLQEMRRKQQEEEERLRREEEERIRKEEEEIRLAKEEAERKEQERLRKLEERAAKKEQLRKEGKLLSKSERAKRQQDLQRLEQMVKMGIAVPAHALEQARAALLSVDALLDGVSPAPSAPATETAGAGPGAALPSQMNRKQKHRQHGQQSLTAEQKEERRRQAEEEMKQAKEAEERRKLAEVLSGKYDDSLGGSTPTTSAAADVTAVDDWEELGEDEGEQQASGDASTTFAAAAAAVPSAAAPSATSAAQSTASKQRLRAPISCILGHVDVGKTKLLDKIRGTNVQDHEAGGITQQIGATFFPMEAMLERIKHMPAQHFEKLRKDVPGLLMMDTPGHESFTNLRSRGSGLCDIAVLVVDLMHGLEPQTIESLNLLRMRKTPFIVALNKVDRLYGWKALPNMPIQQSFAAQSPDVLAEFEKRTSEIIVQFSEQGINSVVYYKNRDFTKYVSLVPTSAITGEGLPDLLMLLLQLSQRNMTDRLMYLSKLECTILEVKVIEGLGTTIDVILVNGELHEGDTIVCCGLNGPIVSTIRALLTPKPMREIRVKGEYVHHKSVQAALGVKICAQDLEGAVAGSSLYVSDPRSAGPGEDLESLKELVMEDLQGLFKTGIDRTGNGVYVQASTLGSLEALLEFLKQSKIPVSGIGIGPIHKKDVMKSSVMLDRMSEYAVILGFDVRPTEDATRIAQEMGVRIFTADIIYHLFDQFTKYMEEVKEQRKLAQAEKVVFPAKLKIIPQFVFNKHDPIVVGMDVVEGLLRVGSPLVSVSNGGKMLVDIGKVASIELDRKSVDQAKKGQQVSVKIMARHPGHPTKILGRSFQVEDDIYTHMTRDSIDLLKELHRDDLSIEDWKFVRDSKRVLRIE